MQIKRPLSVDSGLSDQIVKFANNELKLFSINPAGLGRRFCNLNKVNHKLSPIVSEFADECFKSIGVSSFQTEHLYGNFIGVNTSGAFVHPHIDPRINDKCHVRLNFLIQKPVSGGMPVIDGIEYKIEEGECWINLASEWKHSSTPVCGDRARIVLSLGKYIQRSLLKELND